MKCEYCGNRSGIKDKRGGCVSCGAFSEEKKEKYKTQENNIPISRTVEIRGGRDSQLLYTYFLHK